VSASFTFNILQNCLGLYLSMSGICICNFALFFAQHYLYYLYAYFAGVLDRPYFIRCVLYSYFAFLHSSLYHGAICFSHLLGFLLSVMVFFVITPTATASSIRKSSIFSALRLLSCAYFSYIPVNAVENFVVDVCALHFCALLLYSSSCSPGIHLYTIFLFLSGARDVALAEIGGWV
jgi:hypothetical protein